MYLKYKDADPKDTVERIKRIFEEMGIHLVCRTEKHLNGIYSSYLTDSACHWQTEGKGTTEDYCKASAYGEAMEHLSVHHAINITAVSDAVREYKGFVRYPDEQILPMEKITELSPVILDEMREPFVRQGRKIPQDKELVELWKKILRSDTVSFVPFYHVNQGGCVFLPDAVLSKLCGSNGGGCGNSPEEAIGHALDEVFERWCKYRIFSECLTPPVIPDEYIRRKCPELFNIKQEIETRGKLRVLVMDASLGKEYPVLLIAVIDPETRRYLINFGCHPKFEIALERCFTEIFQDRRVVSELIERGDMSAWADYDMDTIHSQRNWAKLLEDDLGIWPEELFGGVPTWEFAEWREYENYSNAVGMQAQLDRLKEAGAEIYIRDVSFLGFPVYKVYVKGISVSHIDFTEEILTDLDCVSGMRGFINGEMSRDEMCSFGDHVFGRTSILGRMFFSSLSNEDFDLLHAAFIIEFGGDYKRACDILRHWNSNRSAVLVRVLEMAKRMDLSRAADCAKHFVCEDDIKLIGAFFSEHPFKGMLAYYNISGGSRQSMTGDKIQADRDELMKKIKDYMCLHTPDQNTVGKIVVQKEK